MDFRGELLKIHYILRDTFSPFSEGANSDKKNSSLKRRKIFLLRESVTYFDRVFYVEDNTYPQEFSIS